MTFFIHQILNGVFYQKKAEKIGKRINFWLECQIAVIYLDFLTKKNSLMVECYAWLISDSSENLSGIAQICKNRNSVCYLPNK